MLIRKPTEDEEEWVDEIEEGSYSSYALVVERDGRTFALKLVTTLGGGDALLALRDELIALTK